MYSKIYSMTIIDTIPYLIVALSEVAAITNQGRVPSINCNHSYDCPVTRSMSLPTTFKIRAIKTTTVMKNDKPFESSSNGISD